MQLGATTLMPRGLVHKEGHRHTLLLPTPAIHRVLPDTVNPIRPTLTVSVPHIPSRATPHRCLATRPSSSNHPSTSNNNSSRLIRRDTHKPSLRLMTRMHSSGHPPIRRRKARHPATLLRLLRATASHHSHKGHRKGLTMGQPGGLHRPTPREQWLTGNHHLPPLIRMRKGQLIHLHLHLLELQAMRHRQGQGVPMAPSSQHLLDTASSPMAHQAMGLCQATECLALPLHLATLRATGCRLECRPGCHPGRHRGCHRECHRGCHPGCLACLACRPQAGCMDRCPAIRVMHPCRAPYLGQCPGLCQEPPLQLWGKPLHRRKGLLHTPLVTLSRSEEGQTTEETVLRESGVEMAVGMVDGIVAKMVAATEVSETAVKMVAGTGMVGGMALGTGMVETMVSTGTTGTTGKTTTWGTMPPQAVALLQPWGRRHHHLLAHHHQLGCHHRL